MITLFRSPVVPVHSFDSKLKNNKQNPAPTQSMNHEILQTKANFPLDEDFMNANQMGPLKLLTGHNLSLFFCLCLEFMLS